MALNRRTAAVGIDRWDVHSLFSYGISQSLMSLVCPHQDLAIAELWKLMPVSLLEEDADWIQTWRDPAIEEILRFRLFLLARNLRTRGVVLRPRRRKLGRSFPEVVAAQWALESAWGDHTSDVNNYFAHQSCRR